MNYPENELIKILPGQPTVNFKQFGGYVNADDTTLQIKKHFFYYFVEAQINPLSKPLVLWLNEGPGCLSIGYGAFIENGHFTPTENALLKNKYSWNKEANMLYLDSPSEVGFSYSSNTSFYDFVTDDITARDNFAFLQNWLIKFPEYKNRDLFLTGESYAAQLANLLLNSDLKSNLKNRQFNVDFNSRGEYLWSHGLISYATYEMLQNVCNFSQIKRQMTKGEISQDCSMVQTQVSNEIGKLINVYDVTLDVCVHHQQAHLLNLMVIHYTHLSQINRLKYSQDDFEIPILPLLSTIIKQGVRVLVYSGDQDSVIPLTGTRALVNKLAIELGMNTTLPYQPWLLDNQVGGWTQVYGDVLTFATIRAAAHEAPFTQPARSLELFRSFLHGKQLPNMKSIEGVEDMH
ncbi:hypothetical protein RND81_12G011400 [Saponaria officinalis]|uniref:Carboxypeptidase n=1 Tax=Saponaria officinalis TaxID=3572 RepID=A0AAW1H1W6_SAPOF